MAHNFTFHTLSIRAVEIDGNPWFHAADVCGALGLQKPTMAVKPLADAEKRKSDLPFGRGSLPTLISESGLYKLVMRSDKPEAKEFQDWVTSVVLPAIRKDGGYIMGEEKVATGEMSEDELVRVAAGNFEVRRGAVSFTPSPSLGDAVGVPWSG